MSMNGNLTDGNVNKSKIFCARFNVINLMRDAVIDLSNYIRLYRTDKRRNM